ncbi:MAG: hypothetical protein JSW28_00780, partial [Thermoplasmata archaeon]
MAHKRSNRIATRAIGGILLILIIIAGTAFPVVAEPKEIVTVEDEELIDYVVCEEEGGEIDVVFKEEAREALSVENVDDAASNYETITLTFKVDPLTQCSVHEVGGGYHLIEIEGLDHSGRPGEPVLPVNTYELQLPLGSEVLEVAARGENYLELEGDLNIVPGRTPLSWDLFEEEEREDIDFYPDDTVIPDEDVYSMDTYFPGEIASYEAGSDNDHTYVFLRIHPVQYIPGQHRAFVVREITVDVTYDGQTIIAPQSSQETYGSYDDSESIIISPPELLSEAYALEDFHENDEGITTLVVDTSWIDTSYPPAEDPPYDGYNDPSNPGYDEIHDYDYELAKKIISYLRDTGAHPNAEYITILGNGLGVPPSYYIYNDVGQDYESWLPTDFFYSSPDYDYTPNFMVGRLTAADANEAAHLVQKMEDWYGSVAWSWFRNVVVSGGDPFWTVPYVGELICVDSINRESFSGMSIEKQFLTDDTCDDVHMEDTLSNGDVGFVYHIGHGSGDTMWLDYGSVTADEVLNFDPVVNTPVVVSIACDNGAFDTNLMTPDYSGPSFGEAVIASDAAGVAYIGGARTNYGAPEFYFDEGNLNIVHESDMAGMLTYLFEEYSGGADSLGSLAMNAMARFSAEEDMGDFYAYRTFFEFTLLGDPALMIPAQQSGSGYQLPYSDAQEPSGYNGNDIPYYEIPEGREITVESTTDSPDVVTKLVKPFYYDTVEYEANSTTGNTVTYEFIPDDETYYEVRTITEDEKERWLYVLLEEFITAEHDIAVTGIEGPTGNSAEPGEVIPLNATVRNVGTHDEFGITVQFLVDDVLQDEQTITALASGSTTVLTFYWSSGIEGVYDITVRTQPVPDENNTQNNEYEMRVCITTEEARKVAILDSWGTDYSEDSCWDDLNGNWMDFGTIPIAIDYTLLNKDDIEYEDLVNSEADVLLISCAFAWEFTDSEIDAITQYIEEGHGFIATAGTLYSNVPNNNKLAPLFGMRDDHSYEADSTSSLEILEPGHPVFIDIPDPYQMASDSSVTPPDFSWDADDLTEGTYLALSTNGIGAIIENKGFVFITHFVEYESNSDDMQLLYNAMIWSRFEQVDHDVAVTDLRAPDHLVPNEQTYINATVRNLGLNDEYDVLIAFRVDEVLEDSIFFTELIIGETIPVSFWWIAPSSEGSYVISLEAYPVPSEVVTINNKQAKTVVVLENIVPGRIALISDSTELVSIIPILDSMEKPFDVLSDNAVNWYTKEISVLAQYQLIIFYNSDRAIDTSEHSALNNYVELGGTLVVTGIDSLCGPKDDLLADILGLVATGNPLSDSTLVVTEAIHPIMSGPYGYFPVGYSISGLHSNCDRVYADVGRGTVTLAEHATGDDKITVFESGNGRAVFWDGSGPYDWVNDNDAEAMLKNLLIWIMPIYNDVGIASVTNVPEVYIGAEVNVGAAVSNYGRNDQSNLEVLLEVKNSIFLTIHSEMKTGISITSGGATSLSWQWTPILSDRYTFEVSVSLAGDEVEANDRMISQIWVYTRFFLDNMENGPGDWEASTSGIIIQDPLWHLTSSESHSPMTSWWCGRDVTEQYDVWADQYLTSPIIDLTEARTAYLRFHHMYSIDDFPLLPDWGYVEINSNATGWITLDTYNGEWMTWDQVTLDLSSFLGSQMQVRFTL